MASRRESVESITEKKDQVEEIEHAPPAQSSKAHGDAALAILGSSETPVEITDEQDAAILRKVDKWLLPVMLMVYFLQQLDKSSLAYASVFGIVSDTKLVGSQYSWLGSIVYVAQLVWQPVSSYLLVRLPVGKYLFANVLSWGIVVTCTAAAHNFRGLLATRFFLGLFEATVAPSFITITQMWWRRREQTMRLSYWQAMNGVTFMFGSLLAFGIGHIGGALRPYQTIFLFVGLLTVVLSPIVYFVLPDSPSTAKFLSREEKVIAIERLRANNQGTESKNWEWSQVREVLTDPKTYIWMAMQFVCALPSGGISTFGPLIIRGFGFNQFHTILLNIPFGAMQVIVTLGSATIATKLKLKWPVLFLLTLPPIAGASALYMLGREASLANKLLGCYYVLSRVPLVLSMSLNAQETSSVLLYRTIDAPYYHRGLISNIACWTAFAVLTPTMALYLSFLNRKHAAARRRAGKKAVVIDTSLEDSKAARAAAEKNNAGEGEEVLKRRLNDQAFNDLTDMQNEDFIYVL
ncbi:major facilitator superfamily transporter [Ceratobasidium sp. AG-Ba]|nr:major facilitator superfamily transporter [Ceratobasidium sp. AG-Ba]